MSSSTLECDICLVTDATGSMSSSLEAVKISMGQFAYMQTLLGQTGRIGIEAYYDYSDPEVVKWLGWHSNPKSATEAAGKIQLGNGHDTPEAVRTGVFELLKQIDPQRRTIVFWYADAPPHYKVDDSFTGSMQKHLDAEKKALGDNFDWTKLCEQLRDANVVVNSIIDTDEWEIARFFAFMAKKTGGYTIRVPKHATSDQITDATINLMLAFLGAEYNKEKLVWLSSESDLDKSGSFQKKFATPAAVPELQQDLNALITRFKADPHYRDQVYEAFESLSTPENIYAITVNSVLGKLFRTICGQRNDPRRDALLAHFSAAKSGAPKSLQPHIQEWLDQSYNRTEEINGEINEVEQKWPALVLDQKESWTAQELLEITRSCDPKVLARMSLLLAEIQLTETPTKGRFIPIAMADRRLFALIPHLMCEGTEFSGLRAGVIVAMMAVITHQSLLEERAKSWLQSVAGKWFGKDISENFSLSFVRLVLQTNQLMEGKFLTEEEFKFFGFLKRLGGLVANQLTELNLKQPRHAEGQLSADDKLKCHKCGEFRSFTLMTRGQICGLCHYDTLGKENPEKVEGKSRWYECRKCYAHYAVVQVEKLKCSPKCYFCRENQVAPTIECSKCRNKFVTPNGLTGVENVSQSDLKSYVCPPCRDGEKSTSDVAVAVQKFFDQNIPAILACFALEMPPGYNPFDKRSLFVMVNDVKPSATVSPLKDVQNSFGSTMVNRGKPVLNGCEVLQQMVDWVQSDSAQEHSCMLCFSAVSRRQPLQKSCGRRGCLAQACDSCLQSWYGSMKPGELIFPSQLSCPFCKRTPTAKRISAYNKEICWLMPSVEKFDPDWLYAWCRSCYQPKRFLERNCAQHQLPHLDNFECQECVEARLEAIRIADEAELEEQRQAEGGGQPAHRKFKQIKWNTKKCPKCTVKTQKDGGCNHMTCPCGAHWCWVCGKELSYEKIYDHLNAEHGGIYGDNEED